MLANGAIHGAHLPFTDYLPSEGFKNDRWLWLDLVDDDTWEHGGQKVGNVTNWDSKEPTGSYGWNCAAMNENGFWDDRDCLFIEYAFLCEK